MTFSWLDIPRFLDLSEKGVIIHHRFDDSGTPLTCDQIDQIMPIESQQNFIRQIQKTHTLSDVSIFESSIYLGEDTSRLSLCKSLLFPLPSAEGESQKVFYGFFFPLAHSSNEISSSRLLDIGLLATGLFHDLSNELMGINLLANQLSPDDTIKQKLLDKISLMENLSRQVMTYVQQDFLTPELKPHCSVKKVLESTLRLFKLSLPSYIDCSYDLSTLEDIHIPLTQGTLGHVILNILSNAKDAIGLNSGKIEVSFTDNKTFLTIHICDNGCGIKDSSLLFKPFESSKGGREHRGLGLSLCHKILSPIGGQIEGRNNSHKGASFQIILPILHNT